MELKVSSPKPSGLSPSDGESDPEEKEISDEDDDDRIISIVGGRHGLSPWREILLNRFYQGLTGSVTNPLKMDILSEKMILSQVDHGKL
ncbi:hypothetical protein CK203_067356 [Vitis vinifera]|uniref:Uncharacterized protein n=1 Tax=Vitis vinifera TaxID=29760 RepID=A0A438EFP4_VITVI|nr:hypothetical protein CK203_067356 [Vitis vinifera]